MDNRLKDNAFFRAPENQGLYEQSRKIHAINRQNMAINDQYFDTGIFNYERDEFNAQNNKCIRNVDDERPMMFPEYRFKHLFHCNFVDINGYKVCKTCTNCGFNRHSAIMPKMVAGACDRGGKLETEAEEKARVARELLAMNRGVNCDDKYANARM